MPEIIRHLVEGSEILFGNSKKYEIKRIKKIDNKKELRLAKKRAEIGTLNRSIERIKKIKDEAIDE